MGDLTRRGRVLAAAGVALALTGAVTLTVAVRAQRHAPQPPAAAMVQTTAPTSSAPVAAPTAAAGPAAKAAPTRGPVLPAADPVRLDIPAIGVSSVMHPLGLNPDHTVQVPPLSKDSWAGWYRYSPAPGQLGPAIVLGHIDSARYGPGVFFRLGALRPGATVSIARSDRTVAVFRVDRVAEFAKDRFPTLDVYGDTDRPELRLITCGGKFDLSAHSYEDNIVAFASLLSVHPSGA
jgi:Sortase domain